MSEVGVIINLVSFNKRKNPHISSIFETGLRGFSDTTKHRNSWNHLGKGTRVLIYGDKGIRMAGVIEKKYYSDEPVSHWVKNPTGYPLHINLNLLNTTVDNIQPITREELVARYNIPVAKLGFKGWALTVFGGPSMKGITYPIQKFNRIWDDFVKRNNLPEVPVKIVTGLPPAPPKPYDSQYVPPFFSDLGEIACENPNVIAKYEKSLEYVFEEKLWHIFRILGFEVEEYGHKVRGRAPDGALISRQENYVVLFDGKVRKDGYQIGTDDRIIVDYIKSYRERFERMGIKKIYYLIVSSKFVGDYLNSVRRVLRETVAKSVTLLEANLLLHLLEVKMKKPLEMTPKELENVLLKGGVILKEDIQRELGI